MTDKRIEDLEKALKLFAMKNDVDRLYGNIKEIRDEVDATSTIVIFFSTFPGAWKWEKIEGI